MKRKRHKGDGQKVNFWGMWLGVFQASLNRGQFLVAMMGFIYVIMILKMPPEDVSKLMFEILAKLERGYLIGYILGIFSSFGWFIHARTQRRIISREMERIGLEKSHLQSNKLDGNIKSSE